MPPFHRSLGIEKALHDGIIAYEMNGDPLFHDHGAPARLIVPGWAGDHLDEVAAADLSVRHTADRVLHGHGLPISVPAWEPRSNVQAGGDAVS